ncbi:MAG: hypothetical protein ACRC6T_04015 [Sarcina sp.]
MKSLKVRESINIYFLIFSIIVWSIPLIMLANYIGIIQLEHSFSIYIVIFMIVIMLIPTSLEIHRLVNARKVVDISEEGIRCVNHPSQTIANIKWDAVECVDYDISWTRYDYDKVIVFVNGRFKGKTDYYPLKNYETNKEEMLKAIIINTSGSNKTRKIYKTIAHNMMLYYIL